MFSLTVPTHPTPGHGAKGLWFISVGQVPSEWWVLCLQFRNRKDETDLALAPLGHVTPKTG